MFGQPDSTATINSVNDERVRSRLRPSHSDSGGGGGGGTHRHGEPITASPVEVVALPKTTYIAFGALFVTVAANVALSIAILAYVT